MMYLGLYVDDLIYFSESDSCEREFEKKLQKLTTVDLMGTVSHYLGLKFDWSTLPNNKLQVHVSQPAFVEQLLSNNKMENCNPAPTPYRQGLPVDNIPSPPKSSSNHLTPQMRHLVGSLLWLSQATRPDLSTIVSILAQYQSNPSKGHINAARYVLRYLKSTSTMGITFSNAKPETLSAFLQFPVQNKLYGLTDANWGGQDQSIPDPTNPIELPRFTTRSMSGYIISFNGPIHWTSKRQKVTARSSAEAEIYATDECVKALLQLNILLEDLHLSSLYTRNKSIPIHNDNQASILWAKSTTTKGLRHMTIRENATRESIDNNFISIHHIKGDINIADIFTKEMRDTSRFIMLRDLIVSQPKPKILNNKIVVDSLTESRGVLERTCAHTNNSSPVN